MRKGIALLLSLLMLALPILGMGESAEDLASQTVEYSRQYFGKYLLEGQRMTVEMSMHPGEGLLSTMPEEIRTPLKDLMDALTIEVSGQTTERLAQGTLRLKMSGETAADFTGALDGNAKNIYAASSLLGDETTVFRFTPDQTKKLLNKAGDELVSRGMISQDKLDMMKRGYHALRNDPTGTITALIGTPDMGPLMEAVQAVISSPMEMEELTEKPEDVLIDANMVLYIQVEKESLQRLTQEMGRLLWSIPAVQKLAAFVSTDTRVITEESVMNKLNAVPNMLTGDVGIMVYFDETGKAYQAQVSAPVEINGQAMTEYTDLLLDLREETPIIQGVTSLISEGEEPQVMSARYSMKLTPKAEGMLSEVWMEVSRTQGENQTVLMEETVEAEMTRAEGSHSLKVNVAGSMLNASTGEPMEFGMETVSEERDLGDHAEGESSSTLTLANVGEVMTVNTAFRTDMAEAYIVTENALEPLGKEEDRAALNEMIQNLPSTLLVQLLPLVPDSVRNLLFQSSGF